MFGRNDERYKEKCTGKSAIKDLASMEINLNEKLHGGQRKIDRNHNGKIDAEDFKMLRKSKGKMKVTESVTLRESELITLIENIILEKESRALKLWQNLKVCQNMKEHLRVRVKKTKII